MITWKGNGAYLEDKNLGRINSEGYFISNRDIKEHFFRLFKGWGFNKELIEDLINKEIGQVRLIIDNGRKILIANPISVKFKGKDYQADDYEPQWILPEIEFEKIYERPEGELMKYLDDKK